MSLIMFWALNIESHFNFFLVYTSKKPFLHGISVNDFISVNQSFACLSIFLLNNMFRLFCSKKFNIFQLYGY